RFSKLLLLVHEFGNGNHADTPVRRRPDEPIAESAARDKSLRLPYPYLTTNRGTWRLRLIPNHPVPGRLANTPISTTVDSELAKYYLAVSSGHSPGNANVAQRKIGRASCRERV